MGFRKTMIRTIMMSTTTIEAYKPQLLSALGELTTSHLGLLGLNRLLFNFTHSSGYNLLR